MKTKVWINREVYDANRADALREARAIAVFVAAEMCVPLAQIEGRSRARWLVRWRGAIAWLARANVWVEPRSAGAKRLPISCPLIGKIMSGRDHSTVINLIRVAEILRERDPEFRDLTDAWNAAIAEHGALGLVPTRGRDPDPSPPVIKLAAPFSFALSASRKPKNDLSPDDRSAFDRLRGSKALLAAIQREHPERCVAA